MKKSFPKKSFPKNSFRLWYEQKQYKNKTEYWINLLGLEDNIKKKEKQNKKEKQEKGEDQSLLTTFYGSYSP